MTSSEPYTWETNIMIDGSNYGKKSFEVEIVGDIKNSDACFGDVDVTKTKVENNTIVTNAGKKAVFFVTVATSKGCRKIDFTGTVLASANNMLV